MKPIHKSPQCAVQYTNSISLLFSEKDITFFERVRLPGAATAGDDTQHLEHQEPTSLSNIRTQTRDSAINVSESTDNRCTEFVLKKRGNA